MATGHERLFGRVVLMGLAAKIDQLAALRGERAGRQEHVLGFTYARVRGIRDRTLRAVGEHLEAGGCFTTGRHDDPCCVCKAVADDVLGPSSSPLRPTPGP